VFVIGIDPHKGSHSAAVLDEREELVGEVRVRAGSRQREALVAFAARFKPRCWAIEGATGTGALLAQQLVAVGECSRCRVGAPDDAQRIRPGRTSSLRRRAHAQLVEARGKFELLGKERYTGVRPFVPGPTRCLVGVEGLGVRE